MANPSTKAAFHALGRQLTQSIQLVAALRGRGTPFFQLQQISELAFLRIYMAWETFLEDSFTRFMCGASSLSGSHPRSYVKPLNIDHAREILIGPKLRYADWTDPQLVVERAELIFAGGRPFASPVRAATTELNDMRTVRNCIAHRSVHTREQFNRLVQRRLGVARKFAPGVFLLTASPAPPQSYLDFFSSYISTAAQQIVQ
jgi:hypothetical protein